MTANTFPFLLASKHILAFLPSFQITGSLPETKPPNRSSVPWLYRRNHSCLFARFHFIRAMFQAYLQPRETTTFPCLMKWQNNRFAYVEAGAVTGLTTLDLKHAKKIYQQQLSLRYWGSDGQSKLHHLHHRVFKMTIWIKSWSTNLIELMPSVSPSICWIPKIHNTWIIYYKYQSLNKIRQSRKMWKVGLWELLFTYETSI